MFITLLRQVAQSNLGCWQKEAAWCHLKLFFCLHHAQSHFHCDRFLPIPLESIDWLWGNSEICHCRSQHLPGDLTSSGIRPAANDITVGGSPSWYIARPEFFRPGNIVFKIAHAVVQAATYPALGIRQSLFMIPAAKLIRASLASHFVQISLCSRIVLLAKRCDRKNTFHIDQSIVNGKEEKHHSTVP